MNQEALLVMSREVLCPKVEHMKRGKIREATKCLYVNRKNINIITKIRWYIVVEAIGCISVSTTFEFPLGLGYPLH